MLRSLALFAIVAAIILTPTGSDAQSYPRRSIQLHVPYDSNSNAANQIAGVIQTSLSNDLNLAIALGTPESREGKSILELIAAGSGANGYNLTLANFDSHVIAPLTRAAKPSTEIPVLGVLTSSPTVCVVNAKQAVNTLAELGKKDRPDSRLRISSSGKQSHSYLTSLLVLRAAGADERPTHLRLKSPAAALAAVLKGTADFTCVPASIAMQFIRNRQLRVLLSTSAIAGVDLPVAQALGFRGFEVLDEFAGIAGSRRVKADVNNLWQQWLTKLSQEPGFITQASKTGWRAGREQLMLRSQANAVLARKQIGFARLLERYQLSDLLKR